MINSFISWLDLSETFYSIKEARIIIELWRVHYDTIRLHIALGYRPLANASLIIKLILFSQIGRT
ncbi:MAG: hypothetical protein CL609_15145 [Anaerolineaceae bacterium]|nr:hypothetical protein [Anaerolineaceae bacterium]